MQYFNLVLITDMYYRITIIYTISLVLIWEVSIFRYLTYTEWTTLYGGKKSGPPSAEDAEFRRLPFDHCCLTMQPFEHPYSDKKGNVFELQAILDYIKKYKTNPVNGEVCTVI